MFEGRHISPARFDKDGNVISIFSFSKSYAISQKAAEAALELDRQHIDKMVVQYRKRCNLAAEILKNHGLFSYSPQGAFYILVDISSTGIDSNVFAVRLLDEQRVAVAPGATFDPLAGKYICVSLATEADIVAQGMERICSFILKEEGKSK